MIFRISIFSLKGLNLNESCRFGWVFCPVGAVLSPDDFCNCHIFGVFGRAWSAGKKWGSPLSPAVTWLATLSRIILPIKWKSQPPRTERGGGGEGRTFGGASSLTFFSDDYSRDPASCNLQLCFQLCRVGLDDVFGKCPSGPFLGHVDQPVDMVELWLHGNSREWAFWITFRKLNLYLSCVRKIKWANFIKLKPTKHYLDVFVWDYNYFSP